MVECLNGWFTPKSNQVDLNKVTKVQLEAKGREIGI